MGDALVMDKGVNLTVSSVQQLINLIESMGRGSDDRTLVVWDSETKTHKKVVAIAEGVNNAFEFYV